MLTAKNNELSTLAYQAKEMSEQLDKASSVNDLEVFRLQSQLKEFQRQHLDVLEQNDNSLRLKEEEMKRLYSEIGGCCWLSVHQDYTRGDKHNGR